MDLIHHTFLSLRGISNGDDAIVHNDFASACVDAFFYATDYMFGRDDNDRSGSFFISSVCARMLFTQVKRVPVFYPAVFEKRFCWWSRTRANCSFSTHARFLGSIQCIPPLSSKIITKNLSRA